MIDTAFVEQRMRDANPIHGVDDVNADELSRAVAAVQSKRAALRQAPNHGATMGPLRPTPRPLRGRRAWAFAAAFVVILAAIGIAALALRGDNLPVTDEPAVPTTTVTTPDVATTAATDDRRLLTVVPGWQRIDDFWLEIGGWAESLSGGGFVAISSIPHPDGARLEWSPDGLNWFDGDPQRLLPESRRMAVVGDTVIILGDDVDAPTAWIGDPKTGNWRRMLLLNTSGLEETLVPGSFGMTTGNGAVLVTAVTETEDFPPTRLVRFGSVVVWLVDPEQETATRTNLALEPPGNQDGWGTEWEGDWSAWFDGRWHVMVSWGGFEEWFRWNEHVRWSSADGIAWTQEELRAGWQPPNTASWTFGSSREVICSVIDEKARFSTNGIDWQLLDGAASCGGVYSDGLGVVLGRVGTGFYLLSPDGFEELTSPFPADPVAASGSTLIVEACIGSEYTAEECAGYRGLWLYHQDED